ncbi:PP2C family protein-serine/threonine phosphatase [Saccharothrix sp. ST-888]|uniref:PP2C family protein-serine/threonine phosphatase n=1 Tax=Saccharothrix sp. ST-888 TaxID=1427391 RepID=UPI0009E625C6|nr:PP2C family protein-serine/threonine phosphatase [Saccharothrix sp. ST-888]
MADEDDRAATTGADERLLEQLLAEASAIVPYRLPALADRCARALGLDSATIYLADLQQHLLIPLDEQTDRLPVDSSEAGWAYRTLSPRVHDSRDGVTVWLPMVDGAERLGVLGVRAGVLDGVRLRRCRILARLLAMVVTSKRTYSDWLVARTRTQCMTLPTEMLRAFLPPHSVGRTGALSTAVLEPAYALGGDAFDHSVTRNILHASIFDATGHDLSSGLTTAMVMAGCRNARRSRADLPSTIGTVDQALAEWLPEQSCTGVLCRLDVDTGMLQWCNCGHPPPLLIRNERVLEHALESPPQPPMGLPFRLGPTHREVHQTTLEPGDRVLLYTDGVTEARGEDGKAFGLDRFTDFIIRSSAAGRQPSEVLRLLIHAILERQGNDLSDDATILLVEWHPDTRRSQAASHNTPAVHPARFGTRAPSPGATTSPPRRA